MVTLLFKEDLSKQKEFLENTILNGGSIIYPTKNTYCIGARADSNETVDKVLQIVRERLSEKEKASVIVPDFNYIENNFELNETSKKILKEKLPSNDLYILTEKNNGVLTSALYAKDKKIPIKLYDHYIQDIVFSIQVPLLSIRIQRLTKEVKPVSFENISGELLKKVDIIIVDDESIKNIQEEIFELS